MILATAPLEIEGICFRNALLVDNDIEDVRALSEYLEKHGISVLIASNSTDAQIILEKRPEINLIVLDWYLDEEDSMEAKQILSDLKSRNFAPVIIHTHQPLEEPQRFLKDRGLERMAVVLEKSRVGGEDVFQALENWIATNLELKIFLKWSYEVEQKLNDSLWEIHDLDRSGLQYVIETIRAKNVGYRIPDEYELVSILIKVLSRKLSNSEGFLSSVAASITSMMSSRKPPTTDILERTKKFQAFERYISPPMAKPMWTGDIIRNKGMEYFIIVTPSCDLSQKGKVGNVVLLKATPFNEYRSEHALTNQASATCINNAKSSTHYLPYVEDCPEGLLCMFDELSSIPIDNLAAGIEGGDYKRLATIDSPYVENLLQRMNTYLMRLGVRDLGEEEVKRIVEATEPSQAEHDGK